MHTRLQLKGQTHEIIEEEGRRRGQQRTGEEERQISQVRSVHTRLQLKGQTHELIEEEGRRGQHRTGEGERQISQASAHQITVKGTDP